jgi:hypothetical protein
MVLNARSGAVVSTPTGGITPLAVGFDRATQRAFVLSVNDNLLSIVDLRSGALIRPIGVPETPHDLQVDATARRVYVLSPNEYMLQALGDPDGDLYGYVSLAPHQPSMWVSDPLFVDHSANRLLITNVDSTVTLLSENPLRVLKVVAAGSGSVIADIDQSRHQAYLAEGDGASVRILDTRTAIVGGVIRVPTKINQVVAFNGRAYIVSNGTSSYSKDFNMIGTGYLSVLDGASGIPVSVAPIGSFPSLVAHSDALQRVFVMSEIDTYPSLSTLDPAGRVIGTTRLSNQPLIAGHD